MVPVSKLSVMPNLSYTCFYFVDISIVSLQGYTAAQLATESVQEFLREGPLTGGTDVDIQLLEAAKTGDLDLVKVCTILQYRAVSNSSCSCDN